MVEEWRLQELEAAGRMAPATRRQGAMSTAAATAAATTAATTTAATATAAAELRSLLPLPRITAREWCLLQ